MANIAYKNFTGKVKTTAQNAWNGTKSAVNSAKQKARSYSDKLKQAYYCCYSAGYEASINIPECFGARNAASVGFYNGAKAMHKSEKAKQKYAKINNK